MAANGAADAPKGPTSTQLGEFVQRQLGPDVLDLAAGQPGPSSLPLDKIAAAAAHRLAGPGADPLMLQYGPEAGYASFRAALADFLTTHYGHPVSPDELMVTAGVSHGIDLACRKLASPGDTIAVERPTYFLLQPINHLTTLPVPTDSSGLDVSALEALLAGGARPRLLYTVPVHSNPRGAVLPLDRRKALIRLAHRYGFDVIADEVYQLLSFPDAPPPPPPMRAVERAMAEAGELPGLAADAAAGAGSGGTSSAVATTAATTGATAATGGAAATAAAAAAAVGVPPPSRVVSLGSWSKMLAPGLRLGWAEACPLTLKRLRSCGVLISGGCIAPLSAAVAHSTLELGLLRAHLFDHVRPVLAERCTALCDAIDARLVPLGCSYDGRPSGGYFVWLRLPEQVDARRLLEGAAARHCVRFASGPACLGRANEARLSFSFYTPGELTEAVVRLAAALGEELGAAGGGSGSDSGSGSGSGRHD